MELYCLSLRPGNFRMKDVEKSWAVNPLIIEEERRLRDQFPARESPETCFERMKSLRTAAGFETDILLMNPRTGKYE